jgi:subtilisin family serine protease
VKRHVRRRAGLLAILLFLTPSQARGALDPGAETVPSAAGVTFLSPAREAAGEEATFRRDELLVLLAGGEALGPAEDLAGERVRRFPLLSRLLGHPVILVRTAGVPVAEALASLRGDPRVASAWPNHLRRPAALPDDTFFPLQWGLRNTGQEIDGQTGTPGADIAADAAWEVTTGSGEVVVAVIDSGVDHTHLDLAGNLWRNPWETPDNGLDDDGNGYVDDVHGADTACGDGNPMDYLGHGTHVAGTIAARGNNALGIAGVAWQARLMAVKVADTRGEMDDAAILGALEYILEMKTRGVNVVAVNASWGGAGGEDGDLLHQAIRAVNEAGVVFVASAGNSRLNLDSPTRLRNNYPSSYDLPGIVAVAASDADDNRADYSNFGAISVDLAAPGSRIASTYFLSGYRPAPGDLFFDDQESGEELWIHTGHWAVTDEETGGAGHAWSDSPGGDYLKGPNYLCFNGFKDLSPLSGSPAYLGFRARTDLAAGDFLGITIRCGGGDIYSTLSGSRDWADYALRLPERCLAPGLQTWFQIIENGDGLTADGVHLDDVGIGVAGASDGYAFMSGTSMAAPHVTGTLALLAAAYPGDDVPGRINRLLSGAEAVPGLARKVLTGGRLDAGRSLDPGLERRPWLHPSGAAEGKPAGSTVTLSGIGFGTAPGRVLFTDSLLPSFRTSTVRLVFDFITFYHQGYLRLDDIRVGTTSETAFQDDAESDSEHWTIPEWSTMRLTETDWHSPTRSWEAVHKESGIRQGWMGSASDLDLTGLGPDPLRLSWWGGSSMASWDDWFAVWGSDNGGKDWTLLGKTSGYAPPWSPHLLDLPDDPRPVEGERRAWSDTEITVTVPEGAGRHVTVVSAGGRPSLNSVEVGAWTTGQRLVQARVDAAGAVWQGAHWLFGGGSGSAPLDTVERFHPADGVWRADSRLRLPFPRTGAAAAALDGSIYLVGGSGGPGRDVVSLRPSEDAWRSETSLPLGLVHASASALNGRLYVLGGQPTASDPSTPAVSASLHEYDPTSRTWHRRADMATPRRKASLAAHDGHLLVFGGEDATGTPLDSAEAWNPDGDTWTPLAPLPFPLSGAGTATDGRRIFLAGGVRHVWNTLERCLLAYDPSGDAWDYLPGGILDLPSGRRGAALAYLPGYGLLLAGGGTDETLRLDVQRTYPGITLLGPDGGERLRAGSRAVIHWGAPPRARRFRVSWSADGGRTWRTISRSTRRTALDWKVPATDRRLDRCLVRVTGFSGSGRRLGADGSDAPFSILPRGR